MIVAVFDWSYVTDNSSELAHGLLRTLEVSAIAIAGAFVIGAVLGAARAHRIPVVSQLAAAYVEVMRNTPILVQIFFLYFALPEVGIRLRYREAGLALGLSRVSTFLNVTLPIGGRIALPASINTYIAVLKNSALVYVIGYEELTTTALNINALTLQATETFTVLAVVYLTLVWTLSGLIRLLEARLALPESR